jgi:hypothetical protein
MANEIRTKFDSSAAFTISLASLADGSGRQSTMINNSTNRPAAMIYLILSSGATAPTEGATYDVYLLRADDHSSPNYRTDNAGASDAAITIKNAKLIDSIVVVGAATYTDYYGEFDTSRLGPLGPSWGIAVVNRSGQALYSNEGDHTKRYAYYVPEVQ